MGHSPAGFTRAAGSFSALPEPLYNREIIFLFSEDETRKIARSERLINGSRPFLA
jgi:hypothetical protein